MTEADYINLSNRVRLTAALEILRSVIPAGAIKRGELESATEIIGQIQERLFKAVSIDP